MATSHPIDDVRATVLEQDEKHKLLNEEFLQAPHQLVHPPKDAVTDRSAPILSPDTHLEKLPHKELLSEITAGHTLHHVELNEIHDASGPQVDKDVVIHPNRHAELLSEVKAVAAQHTPHMAQPGVDDTSVSGLPLKHVVTEDKTDLKHVLP